MATSARLRNAYNSSCTQRKAGFTASQISAQKRKALHIAFGINIANGVENPITAPVFHPHQAAHLQGAPLIETRLDIIAGRIEILHARRILAGGDAGIQRHLAIQIVIAIASLARLHTTRRGWRRLFRPR